MGNKRKERVDVGLESISQKSCEDALENLKKDKIYGWSDGENKNPSGEGQALYDCLKNNIGEIKDDEIIKIMLRISVIDLTNSTHLSQHKKKANLYAIAKAISDAKVEEDIKNGELGAVQKILEKISGSVKLPSFASKYCYYINKCVYGGTGNVYMKYDTIVNKVLPYYCDEYKVSFKNDTYQNFIESADALLKRLGMNGLSNKYELLDAFIWFNNRDKEFKDGMFKEKIKK